MQLPFQASGWMLAARRQTSTCVQWITVDSFPVMIHTHTHTCTYIYTYCNGSNHVSFIQLRHTVNCCFCHRVTDSVCADGSSLSSARKSTRPGLLWEESKCARAHTQCEADNHFTTITLTWTCSMKYIYVHAVLALD